MTIFPDTPVQHLPVGQRLRNCLHNHLTRMGFEPTYLNALALDDRTLMRIENFGMKCLIEWHAFTNKSSPLEPPDEMFGLLDKFGDAVLAAHSVGWDNPALKHAALAEVRRLKHDIVRRVKERENA